MEGWDSGRERRRRRGVEVEDGEVGRRSEERSLKNGEEERKEKWRRD